MNSLTSKESGNECVREEFCESWGAARDLLVGLASTDETVYFRGQAEANWVLQSKLGRVFNDLAERYGSEPSEDDHQKKEEFQRRLLRHFAEALAWIPGSSALYEDPDEESDEFLALAQHYGVPTELLDWTRSPYIAAFFAFEGDKSTVFKGDRKVAIWALNERALDAFLRKANRASRKTIREGNRARVDTVQIAGNTNRRMVYQEGLFTRAYMVEDDVEKYLRKRQKHARGTILTKIVILGSEQAKALRDLSLMAITPVTLMNDPEGAAATAFNTVVRFGLDQSGIEAP